MWEACKHPCGPSIAGPVVPWDFRVGPRATSGWFAGPMDMTFKQVVSAHGGRHEPAPVSDVAELFRAHHVSLLRRALLMLGDRTSAEDIVQDVYARLQRRLREQADPPADLPGYARAAVLNASRT